MMTAYAHPPARRWTPTACHVIAPDQLFASTGLHPAHLLALHKVARRRGGFGVRVVRRSVAGRVDNMQRLAAGLNAKPLLVSRTGKDYASDYDPFLLTTRGNKVLVEGQTPSGIRLPDPQVMWWIHGLNRACLRQTPGFKPLFTHGPHFPDHMHSHGKTRNDVVFFDGQVLTYVRERDVPLFVSQHFVVPKAIPKIPAAVLKEAKQRIHRAVQSIAY